MCTDRVRRARPAGFTLIELVVFIVVVAVGLAGVLSVFNLVITHSADPMLRKQSLAIGEAFTDEILAHDFAAPGTVHTDPRSQFVGVDDYNTYSSAGVKTMNNTAVAGLGSYNVTIAVAQPGAALGGIAVSDVKQITVTVTDPLGNSYPVTAYKTRF